MEEVKAQPQTTDLPPVKGYWVDLPWCSYREQSGHTPEEAMTKAEHERAREVERLQRTLEWVRNVELIVESADV